MGSVIDSFVQGYQQSADAAHQKDLENQQLDILKKKSKIEEDEAALKQQAFHHFMMRVGRGIVQQTQPGLQPQQTPVQPQVQQAGLNLGSPELQSAAPQQQGAQQQGQQYLSPEETAAYEMAGIKIPPQLIQPEPKQVLIRTKDGNIQNYSLGSGQSLPEGATLESEAGGGTSQLFYDQKGTPFAYNTKTGKATKVDFGAEGPQGTLSKPSASSLNLSTRLQDWTPDIIQDVAREYRGGASLTDLGVPRGTLAAPIIAKIIRAAKQQADAEGDTDWSRGQAVKERLANAGALNVLQKQVTLRQGSEKGVENEINRVLTQLSPDVPRSEISAANFDLYLEGKFTGDPRVINLFNGIRAVSTEYARVIEGQTGAGATTVSGREAAHEMIPLLLGQKSLAQVLGGLKQNMANVIKGNLDEIELTKQSLKPSSGKNKKPAQSKSTKAPKDMTDDEIKQELLK